MAVPSPPAARQSLLAKRTDAERGIIQQTITDFVGVLRSWHSSIIDALLDRGVPLTELREAELFIRQVLNPYRTAFDLVLRTAWEDGAEVGGEQAIRRYSLDIDFDLQRPEVRQALRENGNRASEQIQERMTGDLAEALIEAWERGLGITEDPRTGEPGIVDVLQERVFPDMEDWQAERVARTEVISASNKGSNVAYLDSSAARKQWLSTDDSRTRHSHVEVDGQERPMDEPFETGAGNEAAYPGDPSLPATDRVNCRCSHRPIFN